MNVVILGGGSFGTALAIHLSKRMNIKVWEISKERVDKCNNERVNDLLPNIKLSNNIEFTNNIEIANDADYIIVAVPSKFVKDTVKQITPKKDAIIVTASKGLFENKPLYKIVEEIHTNKTAVMVGPTHAEEVALAKLSSAVIASQDKTTREKVKEIFEDKNFKFQLSDDPLGVSLASGLKNILAVLIGIIDGKQLGDNAKAYAMVKGLEEMKEIGKKLGAKEETFYGLAGLGDIIVTCTSKHSRNRSLGLEIGQGKDPQKAMGQMTMVAEGANMAKSLNELIKKYNLKCPFLQGLYDVLYNKKDLEL